MGFQPSSTFPQLRYTQKKALNATYAFLFNWPTGDLILGAPKASSSTAVTLLGYPTPLDFSTQSGGGIVIHNMTKIPFNKMPCMWMWVLKITGVLN